jgi:hypothetical protein
MLQKVIDLHVGPFDMIGFLSNFSPYPMVNIPSFKKRGRKITQTHHSRINTSLLMARKLKDKFGNRE